jgi:hypothetical protein
MEPAQDRKRDETGAAAMTSKLNSHSSIDERIDHICLSESDRRLAKEHMREADFVANLICRAAGNLRSVGDLLSGVFANRAR